MTLLAVRVQFKSLMKMVILKMVVRKKKMVVSIAPLTSMRTAMKLMSMVNQLKLKMMKEVVCRHAMFLHLTSGQELARKRLLGTEKLTI